MKMKISMLLAFCLGSIAFGQGSLTPPAGTPAPTMKTLDEIDQSVSNVTTTVKTAEPRTPLIDGSPGVAIYPSGAIMLVQSGSYYLTTNLTVSSGNGIFIMSSGVTLDLNGFTIRSTSATASGAGIRIYHSNVSIFNGHIISGTVYDSTASGDQYSGSGFLNGIYAEKLNYTNIRIHDVSVSGCDMKGIFIGSGDSLVESCTVKTVGNTGIRAGVVNKCLADTCGGTAIYGVQITYCRGYSTGGDGISSFGTVANSYGDTSSTSTSSIGIYAIRAVQNSYGYSSGGSGISSYGTVANSYGYTAGTSTDSKGISASYAVQNSFGSSESGSGISSGGMVANSRGYSTKGDGIHSTIVSYSYGSSYGTASSADGIQATIAIGCIAVGGQNITHKYNMP